MKARYKRYQIELLATAEGINVKTDRTADTVIIFLWEKNLIEANKSAHKIAAALSFPTPVGMIEYVIQEVKESEAPAVT